ncbi:MAG: hypothetical protein JWP74_3845 [Marmoricola sp.]|nr:hypothetical protein [Marmoricola sp.]
MPVSLSQISRPSRHSSEPTDQFFRPDQQVLVFLAGISRASMNLECAAVITNNNSAVPSAKTRFSRVRTAGRTVRITWFPDQPAAGSIGAMPQAAHGTHCPETT